MDQRKSLIVTGLALIFIIAIIVGTIAFLVRSIKSRQATTNPTPAPIVQASPVPVFDGPSNSLPDPSINSNVAATPTPTPTSSASPRPSASATPKPSASPSPSVQVNGSLKTYNGSSFSISYPKAWSILTCNNSQNIELDPTSTTDQLNVNCGYALKPITILVGNTSCQGQTVKLGNISTIKSSTQTPTGVNYMWCTQTQPMLNITHRVSSDGSRATSTQDFSSQIEEMIKTFKPGTGS